ncbi:MAG TPA: alpha/beta fold hydrolase [Nitrospiria bacterium]|nr:alpha/beta fold hydrolase [Nitrospiria bacterium]
MSHPFETKEAALARMPGARRTDLFMPAQSSTLVYLIHGVTGTPLEMKYLALKLSRQGRDVYLPTLPGHCLGLRDMLRSDEEDWLRHVQMQLAFCREHYQRLIVGGLSAGALFALEASTAIPLDGVVVLSPTFFYDGWNSPWTLSLLPFGIKRLPAFLQYFFFHIDGYPYGIKEPALQSRIREAYHPLYRLRAFLRRFRSETPRLPQRSNSTEAVGYPIFFLKTLADLDRLYEKVKGNLHRVTAPTLILQSREDDFTGPRNAELVYRTIRSADKRLVLLDDCYHVITIDKQRDLVAEEVSKFIESCVGLFEDSEMPALRS